MTISIPQDNERAIRICDKWVSKIGGGFHPDTRGNDYIPRFSDAECADYEHDMDELFGLPGDPYAFAVEAMERFFEPAPRAFHDHPVNAFTQSQFRPWIGVDEVSAFITASFQRDLTVMNGFTDSDACNAIIERLTILGTGGLASS